MVLILAEVRPRFNSSIALTITDFYRSDDRCRELTIHRGSFFKEIWVPKEYKDTYKTYPVWNAIRGSLRTNNVYAKEIFY